MRYSTAAGRWVIVATVLGSGMASIDATVVGIALPSIGRQFHASLGALQWLVTGYSLALAALLLLGGALGDQRGRRRIYIVGVVWFTLASAACAVAPDPTTLIVTRVIQGAGGALLTPGSLAIIQSSFDREDRGRAIGAWSGLGGVATAAGPLLGGYLIAAASWRWIFLVNLPLGAAVLLLSVRHVPESRDPNAPPRLDLPGAFAAVTTLAGLSYGLIEGPALGWDSPSVVAMLAASGAGTAVFVLVERRSARPMLPLELFAVRQFSVTNGATFAIYAALGGALFLFPTELQVVGGYSPFESGAALLPLTAIMLALSARSGRLASRIGPRLQMSVGPVVVGGGMVLLSRATEDHGYLTGVLPGLVVFGLGLAITVAPLTTTALASVIDEHAGLASAINNDVARLGGLVAVAVLPTLSGISGHDYLRPEVLSSGFRTAVYIAGAVCAAAGVVCSFGISNAPSGAGEAGGAGEPVEAGEAGCAGEPVEAGEAAVVEMAEPISCHYCALDAAPLSGGKE